MSTVQLTRETISTSFYKYGLFVVFFVLILVGFGIPGAIVALLLLRRRKVWRCASCGFAFERT